VEAHRDIRSEFELQHAAAAVRGADDQQAAHVLDLVKAGNRCRLGLDRGWSVGECLDGPDGRNGERESKRRAARQFGVHARCILYVCRGGVDSADVARAFARSVV
jgi:hypothetical protein